MSPVSLYLIGGFLGSGKTTLLQNILSWEIDLSSTVVLINEFGQISIDGMLLESKGSEVVELASGCICCSMRGEFIKSLEDVLNKFIPKRVFVETTGVADTSEVLTLLRESKIVERFQLIRVICVLDADLWEGKEVFGPVFFNQIKAADLVLLNKVDLVDKEKVPFFMEELRRINPDCVIIPTYHCRVDPDVLLREGEESLLPRLEKEDWHPEIASAGEGSLEFVTFLFEEEGALSETRFREFIEKVPFNIFRIKGIVRFPERAFMLNHVGGKSQWVNLEGATGTRLVFVGWDADPEAILRNLNACKEL